MMPRAAFAWLLPAVMLLGPAAAQQVQPWERPQDPAQVRDREALLRKACEEISAPNTRELCLRQRQVQEQLRQQNGARTAGREAERQQERARIGCHADQHSGPPLPRETRTLNRTHIFDHPMLGRAVNWLEGGVSVTVLEECGTRRKMRDPRGVEGWVGMHALQGEMERVRQAAAGRTCEEMQNPHSRRTCQDTRRTQEESRRALSGQYLAGEELRRFIRGKTIEATPVPLSSGQPRTGGKFTTFFDPGGQAFYAAGEGGMATRWRGPWQVEADGQRVCLPGAGLPCSSFLRQPDGSMLQVQNVRGSLFAYRLTVRDGDVAGVARDLERYPQPGQAASGPSANRPMPPSRPPPPLENRPGLLGPAMR